MVSATIENGLNAYSIGTKVRALRQRKKLGVVQLGQHTGLSPAMISKIERGQIHPTLPTLLRIALVFGVGLEHFFAQSEPKTPLTVVRASDRLRLAVPPGATPPPYLFESLNFTVKEAALEGYLATFPPDADPSVPHNHPGAELIYVLVGALEIAAGGTVTQIEQGDAAYIDPGAEHSYHNAGNKPASAIVVVAAERMGA